MKTKDDSLKHDKEKDSKNDYSYKAAESRINSQHPNPKNLSEKDIYPQNNNCNSKVTESFRIDDNSNYSTTAKSENKCIDEPNIPGVGIKEPENEKKIKVENKKK